MMDTITIARCNKRGRATKTFALNSDGQLAEASSYAIGYKIISESVEVTGLRDLYRVLFSASRDPRSFVLRGKAREETVTDEPHRRLLVRKPVDTNDPSLGEEGPFYEMDDHRWLMLDIDGVAFGGDERRRTLHNIPVGVWAILSDLPACFHDRGMIIQWSASAGVKPGIRVHVWFWSSRAVCDDSLRAWAKEPGRAVDPSPFNAVQPCFIADPIFTTGDDPVGVWRWQYVDGPPVELPCEVRDSVSHERMMIRERKERVAKALVCRARALLTGRSASQSQVDRYVRAALRSACDKILAALEGDRHVMIAEQSLSTGGLVLAGALNEGVWRNEITAAAEASVGEKRARSGEIKRLLDGALDRAEPTNLDHVGQKRGER